MSATAPSASATNVPLARFLPGLLLCAAVVLAALGLAHVEEALFGRAWIEALVLSILIGAGVRSLWAYGPAFKPGVDLSAKLLLEIAVMLLGASLSAATVMAIGLPMLLAIAVTVAAAIIASYALGRVLGLPRRMAVLVACGNAICGNSAIASVAPVIGANGKDVAASIAFTAVLGVLVVLGLPFLAAALSLTETQSGILAGLTVYAVPQVLAAAAPMGSLAVQVGTLVKLVRVLMLGPVVLVLALLAPRLREAEEGPAPAGPRPKLSKLVPWFILGFLGLAALRSIGLVPMAILPLLATISGILTMLAMAALGLGVDLRVVAKAGGRVTATVVCSLLALGTISLALIHWLTA